MEKLLRFRRQKVHTKKIFPYKSYSIVINISYDIRKCQLKIITCNWSVFSEVGARWLRSGRLLIYRLKLGTYSRLRQRGQINDAVLNVQIEI